MNTIFPTDNSGVTRYNWYKRRVPPGQDKKVLKRWISTMKSGDFRRNASLDGGKIKFNDGKDEFCISVVDDSDLKAVDVTSKSGGKFHLVNYGTFLRWKGAIITDSVPRSLEGLMDKFIQTFEAAQSAIQKRSEDAAENVMPSGGQFSWLKKL
ncbi:MAG: hypothetical protein AB1782_18565 [Cyanobacteriota bacterium]